MSDYSSQIDAVFKNITNKIQKDVNSIIQNEIKKEALKVIKTHSELDFYHSYTPVSYGYKRRFDLLKDNTYDVNNLKDGISISSDFQVDSKNLLQISEEGASLGLWDRFNKGESYSLYNRDSHFFSNARKEIQLNIKSWLIRSLKSRGYNCH
jgi:hypothetical protein